jgi:hypothetical protein
MILLDVVGGGGYSGDSGGAGAVGISVFVVDVVVRLLVDAVVDVEWCCCDSSWSCCRS